VDLDHGQHCRQHDENNLAREQFDVGPEIMSEGPHELAAAAEHWSRNHERQILSWSSLSACEDAYSNHPEAQRPEFAVGVNVDAFAFVAFNHAGVSAARNALLLSGGAETLPKACKRPSRCRSHGRG
jgi:hypothetical protein